MPAISAIRSNDNPVNPLPRVIAAKSLHRRKQLLAALLWLALSAIAVAGGLVAFQVRQLWGFDEPSWLALASGLGIAATLAGMALALRWMLAWRSAEAALLGYAEVLTSSRQPVLCRLEIPAYQRRAAKNLIPLASLQLPADEFSEAREEILAFDALNVPPRDDGDGLLWQGELGGKPIRIVVFGQRLLTGYPVTEEVLHRVLARQAKNITLGVMLGSMLVVGLTMGFVGLEALEIQDRLQKAQQSGLWPTAPGVVLVAETRPTKISQGKQQVDAFRAFVLYSYVVGGKSFEGRTLHFAYEADTRRESADALIRRYPEGTSVAVYHHPQRLRLSTLEPGHADELRERLDNRLVVLFLMPLTLLIAVVLIAIMLKRFWGKPGSRR